MKTTQARRGLTYIGGIMFRRLHASGRHVARVAWIACVTVCAPMLARAEEAAPATARVHSPDYFRSGVPSTSA
jgi:hypothetical protein